jgi:predicted AlkP superfamily pyrophosphatase or phosphodiesterase
MRSLRLLVLAGLVACQPLFAAGTARHVVLVIWDGMRPDFVSEKNTPTLFQLAQRGVSFSHHHSTYLSATEVNGTAINTGVYPNRNGIVGNHEFRPQLDPRKSIRTEGVDIVRKNDRLTKDRHIRVLTLAETVRLRGRKTAVAGAKPVALLADRAARSSLAEGGNVFAGATLPPSLWATATNQLGPFPAEHVTGRTRNDWTTDALLKLLWANGIPHLSVLWLNEPDSSQHHTSPGSDESLAGMRNSDQNLAQVLATLEANGSLDKTDIIVVSDHGCSTISATVDLAAALSASGLKASREFKNAPQPGEILIVSNSGSSFIYVTDHDEHVIRKVVAFLRGWEAAGVIFTRKAMPGTFALADVRLDSEEAPDIVVSLRWTAETNKHGVQGMLLSEKSSFSPGQGLHVSLSPFDMRSTLIAAGPDFRAGVVSTLASGNVDIAPTILWILGLQPAQPLDGRVLSEALTAKGPPLKSFEPFHIEASHSENGVAWRQYLNFTKVNGVLYVDEGNGTQVRN